MAEIISNTKGNGRKRLSTRIDLTPMVDLGFLLITFFIFTTTMLEPSVMKINMPSETPTTRPTEIPDYCAMKIFIGEQHKIFYLKGKDAMNNNFVEMKEVSFEGKQSIRKALIAHVNEVSDNIQKGIEGSHADDKAFILLKVSSKSDYSDLVNLFDELAIVGIKDYALVDIAQDEENAVVAKL